MFVLHLIRPVKNNIPVLISIKHSCYTKFFLQSVCFLCERYLRLFWLVAVATCMEFIFRVFLV